MGQSRDLIDTLDCSDQRLVLRLILQELKRLRSTSHKAQCVLAEAKDDCRTKALEILQGELPWTQEVLRGETVAGMR